MDSIEPANILVVRLGAMGDVLHTLPAVSTLKHSFPRAHITWAIEPQWAPLLRDNPAVDRVIPLDLHRWRRRWWRLENWNEFLSTCRDLRTARFDLALDFQGLIKSAMVATAAYPDRILGFHQRLVRERAAGLFYSEKVHSDARHMVDLNLDLVAAAGAHNRCIEFPLPDCAPEGDLPSSDFVLASPIAGWKAKQWPPAYYGQLARRLRDRCGWPLVINCSPADREEAEAIVKLAPPSCCLLNITSIEGLIGVTRRARAVVGLDSGPLHIADALGKPGVALHGPTDPARNGPYGSTIAVLRAPGASTTHRRSKTIDPSMEALAPDAVFEALEARIAQYSLPEPHR
jgi:heptosyltransferase-1